MSHTKTSLCPRLVSAVKTSWHLPRDCPRWQLESSLQALWLPAKAFAQLGVEDVTYENALDYNTVSNKQVSKGDVLFPRLDAKVELEYFESQMPDI